MDLYDDATLLRMAKAMAIQKSDIEGKILIAGVGVGTERDYFMSVEEAKEFGMIDEVVYKRPKSLKKMKKQDLKSIFID